MFILAVIFLGMLFSVGSASMWYQVTSLYEAAAASCQKEQRVAYAEGILAYGVQRYQKDTALREKVATFGKQEVAVNPPFALERTAAVVIYEHISPTQVQIQAVVSGAGWEELLLVQCAVQ